MAALTTFYLTEEEKHELETTGEFELNHHWQLWKFKKDLYSCTWDGMYEEFYTSLQDLLVRKNELILDEEDIDNLQKLNN